MPAHGRLGGECIALDQTESGDYFSDWFQKIGAEKRAKAVCKPCWELRYCPYGPLVEEFPLSAPEERDHKSCKIFGHDCPVFYVNEPFTETRELRTVSRKIPRPVQIRVLARDNSVCRSCGSNIPPEAIHFDHDIPWSKGGASDESNIQLLCEECNLRKSDRYERDNLIPNAFWHQKKSQGIEILDFIEMVLEMCRDVEWHTGNQVSPDSFANFFNEGVIETPEREAVSIYKGFVEVLTGRKTFDMTRSEKAALKDRWGFSDGVMYDLKSTAEYHNVVLQDLALTEISLVERFGWRVDKTPSLVRKWKDT